MENTIQIIRLFESMDGFLFRIIEKDFKFSFEM